MKENLKVLNINGETEWHEVKSLFFSLGFSSVISGLTFMFTDKQRLPCRDITLPELRELARPKEYLNDKFELVVTNQPDDRFILVPEGAEHFTEYPKFMSQLFWKTDENISYCHPMQTSEWVRGDMNMAEYIEYWSGTKTLWQRENKVEAVKGRFLHQWAYEAFGRGEDVQHTPCERDCDWTSTSIANPISIFSAREMKFRLKPQTITIGSRTITKPISVKPERGTTIYIAMLTDNDKYDEIVWNDYPEDNLYLSRNLCHLTAVDAIAHCDALLELMK